MTKSIKDLLDTLDINKISDPSGGSASSGKHESSYYSCNSSLHSHNPSSSEGLISLGSGSSSSSVNQPSPLESFSVNQPSPLTEEISGEGGSESISSPFNLGDNPANPILIRLAIHKKIYDLINSTQRGRDIDIMAATDRICRDNDKNITALEEQYEDLVKNGAESKAFKCGVGDLANFAAESPLELFQFAIPLALALGLFLFLVFIFLALRKVWKNRSENVTKSSAVVFVKNYV